jgi:hypothetical protein
LPTPFAVCVLDALNPGQCPVRGSGHRVVRQVREIVLSESIARPPARWRRAGRCLLLRLCASALFGADGPFSRPPGRAPGMPQFRSFVAPLLRLILGKPCFNFCCMFCSWCGVPVGQPPLGTLPEGEFENDGPLTPYLYMPVLTRSLVGGLHA